MYIHGMLENAIDVNRCTRPTKKKKSFHTLICAKIQLAVLSLFD